MPAALESEVFLRYLTLIGGLLAAAGVVLALLSLVLKKELGSIWRTYRGWLVMAPLALVTLVVVLAGASELTGVAAVQIGASCRYDGPFGKSDRAFAFGLLALLLGCGLAPGRWVDAGLPLALALSLLTVLNRARRALAESDHAGRGR